MIKLRNSFKNISRREIINLFPSYSLLGSNQLLPFLIYNNVKKKIIQYYHWSCSNENWPKESGLKQNNRQSPIVSQSYCSNLAHFRNHSLDQSYGNWGQVWGNSPVRRGPCVCCTRVTFNPPNCYSQTTRRFCIHASRLITRLSVL